MAANKFEALATRLRAVKVLRFLKERMTYSSLSGLFGIPPTVLSRYVLGHVVPLLRRAEEIYRKGIGVIHDQMLWWVREHEGFFDAFDIVNNSVPRYLVASWIAEKLAGHRVNKVLVPAVNGIPLATTVADELGVPLVVAKREKDVAVPEYWSVETHVARGVKETWHVPRHALGRKDWVVIVDDIIRTGATVRALARLVGKARARLVGVYALLGVGPAWRSLSEELGVPVDVFIKVNNTSR